jgi:V-type H+-transporting ATPase subunit C
LGELIENLQKELQNIDNDVKAKFNQYNGVKTALATLQRKQTWVALDRFLSSCRGR